MLSAEVLMLQTYLYQSLPGFQNFPSRPLWGNLDRYNSIRSRVVKLWLKTSALSPTSALIVRMSSNKTILPLKSTSL